MRPALEQAALPIATLVDASKRGQLQMLVTKMHANARNFSLRLLSIRRTVGPAKWTV